MGTSQKPPAARIALTFDRNLIALPDARPGKSPDVHRSIRTLVELKLDTSDGSTLEVSGFALFYCARGDSVAIPAEERGRGMQPDRSRWWLDRSEDETMPPGGFSGNASRALSLAQVLRLYLPG